MMLAGDVALVTGASRGIGRAIALRLAAEGARVAVNHPGERAAAAAVVNDITAAGGSALAVEADVSVAADVARMTDQVNQKLGPVQLLVNNAGICPFTEFFDITEELWDRVHAVNLKGPFLCSQAVARTLVARQLPGRRSARSPPGWAARARCITRLRRRVSPL